jgi:hypothetical protein
MIHVGGVVKIRGEKGVKSWDGFYIQFWFEGSM